MALHPDLPKSPYESLDPDLRWFPADESLRETSMEKLIPPLVDAIRRKVKDFRGNGYDGATVTSKNLLNWWFNTSHMTTDGGKFIYYFAQREAMESIVYLYEVAKVKDKVDLIRFDSSKYVSQSLFDENWLRFVVKMATGSGKTKVMSLAMVWSYFNKLYEPDSRLSRNFLVIAPNIIVLDRLYRDFQGLKIFFEDPAIPDDGYADQNWRSDFQVTLHKQDDVSIVRPTGNIFLTNIHRVYSADVNIPSFDDSDTMNYFLGMKPVGETTDSKIDLGNIVRDIDELMILNDEAHHIHDKNLSWFKSIEDINNNLLQKGSHLSLQIDVTATPKHNDGSIFVQTISDYPLVEAIHQNIVKHPILPDAPSRSKLRENQSNRFTERYKDYINLGVIEWRKSYEEHIKVGKKSILFIMTDDTRNCDDVAAYLESHYPELKGKVLVIHTKNNGEISESTSSGKSKEELEKLRDLSNKIDDLDNDYKAIVSVLMLKEGWDVRNVTTIVGLRAYSATSNILPEQTLGRGLRRMYRDDFEEYVSVIGTDAFMEFVESIQTEGVELERKPMGTRIKANAPIVIEIDEEKKNIDDLDIEIPVLTPRIYREYKNLDELDIDNFEYSKIIYRKYSQEEQRQIIFKDITTEEIIHITTLDSDGMVDSTSVIGFFTKEIMKELRLVSGYDILYGKVKIFIRDYLFTEEVDLDSPNTMRNLSEPEATRTIIDTFKKAINSLTIRDKGSAEIKGSIKLRQTRPFMVKDQPYNTAKKSVFNKIVGDSNLELRFAQFLEDAPDVISYAKNYFAINFKLDYTNANGDISNYYPDFFVKTSPDDVIIVETKGLEDLDVPLKMARLKQWCEDINFAQQNTHFDYVFVDQESFDQYKPKSMEEVMRAFKKYKSGD